MSKNKNVKKELVKVSSVTELYGELMIGRSAGFALVGPLGGLGGGPIGNNIFIAALGSDIK